MCWVMELLKLDSKVLVLAYLMASPTAIPLPVPGGAGVCVSLFVGGFNMCSYINFTG